MALSQTSFSSDFARSFEPAREEDSQFERMEKVALSDADRDWAFGAGPGCRGC